MEIKFSSIKVPSSLIPHEKKEFDQTKQISEYIYEAIRNLDTINLNIDEKILFIYSIFTSKLVDNVLENSYSYLYGLKGYKYLSGDISIVLSETITFATLHTLYDVKIENILPFRTVKYLGTIADALIDLEKESKLAKELETESGLLFINIRAAVSPRFYYVVDKIWKSILNLELVRYPDNYGLISLLTRDKETLKESFIFITPQ